MTGMKQEFGYFLKNAKFRAALGLTLLLSYGYAIATTRVSIDSLEGDRYIGTGGVMLSTGRFGMNLWAAVLGYGRAEPSYAFGIDLLAALLLKKHGLSVNELYTHNHWMGHPDSIVQGARKNCPLYILPHWAQFKQKVAAKLAELNGGATTTETGKTEIMGKAKASAQQMALFARSKNAEPQLPACSLEQLAQFFLEEGEAEGVRGDVAFAQSLHETGFFKYGGIVLPTQNNYAGIGALNGNAKGQAATFPDPRTGVRAQIQHLKAYASKETLVNGCVDPRFSLVTRGSAQYVEWLGASDNPNGKGWAVPGKGYGGKIVALLGQIMAFEVPQPSAPSEPEEQEPEFPAYQLEGLETLTEAGVINSPEFWRQKFSEQVTVGEMFGILGKLFTKVTE